jgi:hypothetical protein
MELPSPCPVCGAYSLAPQERHTTLLAVCDVLTLKALEVLGKFIVRDNGARYAILREAGLPFAEAHTLWPAPDNLVDRALRGRWDVIVPIVTTLHGCEGLDPEEVVCACDEYVHDLAITGTPHHIEELAYRFTSRLGLPTLEAAWA